MVRYDFAPFDGEGPAGAVALMQGGSLERCLRVMEHQLARLAGVISRCAHQGAEERVGNEFRIAPPSVQRKSGDAHATYY